MIRKKPNESRLEDRLAQASDTIANLNSMLSAIGVIAAFVSILLVVAVYFFGIKPSQDAVEKLERTMDERISLYFENMQRQQIDKAIDSIGAERETTRYLAYASLEDKIEHGLTDVQLLKLIKIIKTDDDVDPLTASNVNELFLYIGKNDLLHEYFYSIMERGTPEKHNPSFQAFRYFLAHGNTDDINRFKVSLASTSNKKDLYVGWLGDAATINKQHFLTLLWSKDLVDILYEGLTEAEKEEVCDAAIKFSKKTAIDESELTDSYCFKQLGQPASK